MAAGRKTGGRSKGTPNKATAEVKDLAREHGPAAIAKLRAIMDKGASEQAQVAAAKELLDRAYGKATQTIAGDPEAPLQMAATIDRPPRETREQWEARRAAQIAAGSA